MVDAFDAVLEEFRTIAAVFVDHDDDPKVKGAGG